MFSDAISSISCRWRPSSPLIAAAISGSASASVAVKNESGAEAVLELGTMRSLAEISPPPQALRGKAGGLVWRSKEAPARYHIGRNWPSTCGIGPDIYARYGGEEGAASLVAPALSRGPYPGRSLRDEGVGQGAPSRGRGVWVPARASLGPERRRVTQTGTPRPSRSLRWNAGRACIRPSQAARFGYGSSLPNTFAISPTKLIWMSAPVSDGPTKNSRPFSAPST